jgi:hypothetical protein
MNAVKLMTAGAVVFLLSCGLAIAQTTTTEQRIQAVKKIQDKYPCDQFHHESDQGLCGKYAILLARDEKLQLPEKEWKELIQSVTNSFQEWKVESDRMRNQLKPKLGMSQDQIYKHVLGPPKSINDTLDARGQTSQWVYETDDGTMYLYFNAKGILVSMQRSR